MVNSSSIFFLKHKENEAFTLGMGNPKRSSPERLLKEFSPDDIEKRLFNVVSKSSKILNKFYILSSSVKHRIHNFINKNQ